MQLRAAGYAKKRFLQTYSSLSNLSRALQKRRLCQASKAGSSATDSGSNQHAGSTKDGGFNAQDNARRDANYYENVMHGVVTREQYDLSNFRAEDQIEGLGRIYIYQYHACPFCGKVKAFLDYYKVPYTLIEVNPMNKKQLPNRRIFLHDRQVPVMLANPSNSGYSYAGAKVMHNSWAIIEAVMLHLVRIDQISKAEYNRATGQVVTAWRQWMDERLIPHLFAAVQSKEVDSMQYFRYIEEFPKFYRGGISSKFLGTACAQLFNQQVFNLKQQYGILDGREYDMLYDAIAEWNEVTAKSLHGGTSPDMADVMVFGILRTFEQLNVFDRILADTDIGRWYDHMLELVGEPKCTTHI